MAGLFGQAQQPGTLSGGLFGQTPQAPSASSGGLFGQPSGGLFGQTQQQPSTISASGTLFGQPSQPSTGTPFGQPSTTTSSGGLFGPSSQSQQPSATTSAPLGFGQPTSTAPSAETTLFGQPPPSVTTTSSGGGLFGSSSQTSQQPSTNVPPPSGGLFFGQTTQQPPSGGLFGQQPSGGLFGQTQQQPSTATATSPGGLFGQQTSQPSTGTLFGQPTSTSSSGGGGGGLYGQQTSQPSTLSWGLSGAAQPASGGLFSRPAAPSGLFGQASGAATSGDLFGGVKPPQASLFSATPGLFGGPSAAAAPGLFGASQQQRQPLPIEVQAALGNVSNPDARSCQVLVDVFTRLKSLTTEQPPMITFTYEREFDSASVARRRTELEQQVERLNNPTVTQQYLSVVRRNPDPTRFVITPLQGFDGLVTRAEKQAEHFERLGKLFAELKSRQERVANHLKITTVLRLQDMVRRQRSLQTSFNRVVDHLEEFALRTRRAQVDTSVLRRLRSDAGRLSETLQLSSAGRAQLGSIASRVSTLVRALNETGASRAAKCAAGELRDGGGNDLTERDLHVLTNLVQKQQQMSEKLGEQLRRDLQRARRLFSLTSQEQTSQDTPNAILRGVGTSGSTRF